MPEIIDEGEKKYIIDEPRDREIFEKVKKLEQLKLNKNDKETIKLIKTQIEGDWRKYLLEALNKLLIKYKIS